MNRQLIDQLESMKGKTYLYGARIHCVLNIIRDNENSKVLIKTNLDEYVRSYESISEFLNYWKEADGSQPVTTTNNAMVVMEKENAMVDKLTGLLMDNIEKVQKDPNYIKQAQSINNNVNSIINLTKLKLDVFKQTKGKKI